MGRTSETARHEFISDPFPTEARAEALCAFLGGPDAGFRESIDVLCVRKGAVDWGFERGGRWPNRVLYGKRDRDPTLLGNETGFLVRFVSQFAEPTNEEVQRDQQQSWEDYHGLALWLLTRAP